MNGQYPSENVAPWLAVDKDPPDVYSLGWVRQPGVSLLQVTTCDHSLESC